MILTDDERLACWSKHTAANDYDKYSLKKHVIRALREHEAAVTEKLIQSLGLYDVRPSNIWRHFYPNVNGTYIKLEELKEKLK